MNSRELGFDVLATPTRSWPIAVRWGRVLRDDAELREHVVQTFVRLEREIQAAQTETTTNEEKT